MNNQDHQCPPQLEETGMTRYTLKRTGHPPLVFVGELFGFADNEFRNGNQAASRWTEVKIYKTRAGKYIAYLAAVSPWQGEDDCFKGGVFSEPEELIDFLKSDEGYLDCVSQRAIERACVICPEIDFAFREFVD